MTTKKTKASMRRDAFLEKWGERATPDVFGSDRARKAAVKEATAEIAKDLREILRRDRLLQACERGKEMADARKKYGASSKISFFFSRARGPKFCALACSEAHEATLLVDGIPVCEPCLIAGVKERS